MVKYSEHGEECIRYPDKGDFPRRLNGFFLAKESELWYVGPVSQDQGKDQVAETGEICSEGGRYFGYIME